jgi:predicted nucleotidyltransferase component of viral defense system
MIPQIEIRRFARESGVPETTIERDYAQNWFLKCLASLDIVLKGGTAIRKVYIDGYRFSDDLDFTMSKDIPTEKLRYLISQATSAVKDESGIMFSNEIRFEENINGYEARVQFNIFGTRTNPMNIKLDITKPDMEKIIITPEIKKVIHPYSDKLSCELRVYSFDELVAEKIRSLFQRTRPRDLYDVWFLQDKADISKILPLFLKKCQFIKLVPDIEKIESRKDDFLNAWNNSLRHQMKTLPNFNEVFLSVISNLKQFIKP